MMEKSSILLFEIYLYFCCHFQLLLMLGMWEVLRYILDRFNVEHKKETVLGPNSASLWRLMATMAALLVVCLVIFILLWCFPDLAFNVAPPIVPVLIYPFLILVVLALPSYGFFGTLWSITVDALCLWRPGPPSFRDAFMMDLLTSFTKALSDMTCSAFRWGYGDKDGISRLGLWVDDLSMCGGNDQPVLVIVAVSIAMSLPYLFRLLQCLRDGWNAAQGSRMSPFLNAGKYVSSILVVIFSGVHTVYPHDNMLFGLYIAVAFLNSVYAGTWDIKMDWDMCGRKDDPNVRPKQIVWKWVFYSWLFISDLLARFSWGFKLWLANTPYSSAVIFIIAITEIVRRYQWAYFRVEREATGGYVKEYRLIASSEDDTLNPDGSTRTDETTSSGSGSEVPTNP